MQHSTNSCRQTLRKRDFLKSYLGSACNVFRNAQPAQCASQVHLRRTFLCRKTRKKLIFAHLSCVGYYIMRKFNKELFRARNQAHWLTCANLTTNEPKKIESIVLVPFLTHRHARDIARLNLGSSGMPEMEFSGRLTTGFFPKVDNFVDLS
jgi:hypothetical protein